MSFHTREFRRERNAPATQRVGVQKLQFAKVAMHFIVPKGAHQVKAVQQRAALGGLSQTEALRRGKTVGVDQYNIADHGILQRAPNDIAGMIN